MNHGLVCVVDINSRVFCLAPTHTYLWLILIIKWCRPFPFVPTNILLIKSKLKLESRAIAVGVAMSPRNLGSKYRCRPHPRPRTYTRQFLREPERGDRTAPECVIAWRPRQHRRSRGVFKSWISVAHCPFERKRRVLQIWLISVLEQVGMSFDGIAHSWWRFCFYSSESSLVCSMMTWHTASVRISNVRSPM